MSRHMVLATTAVAAIVIVLVSIAFRAPLIAGACLVAFGLVLATNVARATSAWAAFTVELRRQDMLWRVSWPFNERWSVIFTRMLGLALTAGGTALIVKVVAA